MEVDDEDDLSEEYDEACDEESDNDDSEDDREHDQEEEEDVDDEEMNDIDEEDVDTNEPGVFRMPTTVRQLQNLVRKLRLRLQSLNNSARAQNARAEFHVRPEHNPRQTERQKEVAKQQRECRKTQKVLKNCEKYAISLVCVINRLGLSLKVVQLEELRKLGFLERENVRPRANRVRAHTATCSGS